MRIPMTVAVSAMSTQCFEELMGFAVYFSRVSVVAVACQKIAWCASRKLDSCHELIESVILRALGKLPVLVSVLLVARSNASE